MLQSHAKVCTPIVRHDANFYIKTKYYVLVENRYNQKNRHFRIGFCFAPPIGESYNFDVMIAYSILLKSRV